MPCDCGQPRPNNALRCDACNRKALKRFVKIVAVIGGVLGLLCSQLPTKYQAPCHMIAQVTQVTCGGI